MAKSEYQKKAEAQRAKALKEAAANRKRAEQKGRALRAGKNPAPPPKKDVVKPKPPVVKKTDAQLRAEAVKEGKRIQSEGRKAGAAIWAGGKPSKPKSATTTKPFTLIKPAQAGGMPKETTPKPTRKPGRGRSTVGGGVQSVKTVTPEHMKVPKKRSKPSTKKTRRARRGSPSGFTSKIGAISRTAPKAWKAYKGGKIPGIKSKKRK